jgi:hypothetical protein
MNTHDSSHVSTLLDRYLIDLDQRGLDDRWARSLFTEDACVEFPMSRHDGVSGLAEYHSQALAKFQRTQHLSSPAVVELNGDEARLHANVISTHVHHPGTESPAAGHASLFVTGTRLVGTARRTGETWRLTRLCFELVWVSGSPTQA